jgi:hypothetical protein
LGIASAGNCEDNIIPFGGGGGGDAKYGFSIIIVNGSSSSSIITPGSLIFFGVREIAKKIENPGVVMVLAISRNLA